MMKEYGKLEMSMSFIEDRNVPKVMVNMVKEGRLFGFIKPI
jgi:hypothetical protein